MPLRRVAGLIRQQGKIRDWEWEWVVCDEYEISNEEIVAKPGSVESAGKIPWRTYSPLKEAPDLFLKLAAMYEAPSFREAALTFSHKYGVLGGSSTQPGGGTARRASLSSWWEETERAWLILKLYEAALNRDEEALGRLADKYPDRVLSKVLYEQLSPERYHEAIEMWGPKLGLIRAAIMVEQTVQLHCRPALQFSGHGDTYKARIVWQFENLLGAMYLQMFWLIASDDDLGRCEYCGRIFFMTRTHPEGRKRRRDRRFCDDACRQAHHRSKKNV